MTKRTDRPARWPLRPLPEHLQRRYPDSGFWLDTTLGAFVDERLRINAALELRICSATRPYRGTIGGVRALAQRVAGGLRAAGVGAGDVVAFQLPNWVEAAATFYGGEPPRRGAGADRALLRREGGRLHPRGTLEREGVRHRRPFGHRDYLADLATLRAPSCRISKWSSSSASTAGRAPVSFDDARRRRRRSRSRRASTHRARARRLHVGHHAGPEGRRALAPHASLPRSRQLADMQSGGALPTLVGAPVGHAIGMLAALLTPPLAAASRSTSSTCGIPPTVLAAMLEADLTCGSGATYFLTSLLDAPDFTAGAPDAHGRRRSRRRAGAGRGRRPCRELGHLDRAAPTARPSTRRSPARRTTSRPTSASTPTAVPLPGVELRLVDDDGKEVAAGRAGRDPEPRPRLLRRLHRPVAHRRGVRRRRLVRDRRHRRARRRRAT